MQSSEAPIRTHFALEDSASFQEMMGERLKQSPWLLLSAGLHAVLLLLIWVFMPPEAPKKAAVSVQMTQTDKQEIVKPPPPPPPPTKAEVDPEITPTEEVSVVDRETEALSHDDALESPTPRRSWSPPGRRSAPSCRKPRQRPSRRKRREPRSRTFSARRCSGSWTTSSGPRA